MNTLTLTNTMTLSSGHLVNVTKRVSNLAQAELNQEYTIKGVKPEDPEIVDFLFTLGCFEGEKITLIATPSDSYLVSIKDARYSIGSDLAQLILI